MLSQLKRFFTIPGAKNLLITMSLYGLGLGMLNPMNAIYLSTAVHLSKLEISSLISISLVMNVIVTFVSGLLSDKMHRRKALPTVASAIAACGLLGYLYAHSFVTALLFYILFTVPASAMIGQLYAMARAHFKEEVPDMLETSIVWLRTMLSIGFVMGLFVGSTLYTFVTFRGVIMGDMLCYLLMFVLFLSYRERYSPTESKEASAGTGKKMSLGSGLRWIVISAIMLQMCCDAVRGLYFPLMVDSLYHRPTLVSHLWAAQAAFEFLWMTLAGWASQRFGDLKIIIIGGICAIGVYGVYAIHPQLTLLFAVQPIYSIFVSVLNTIAMGAIQRMFLHRTGFGSSLYFVLSQAAFLFGYMVPNVFPGFSPHIFYFPMAMMVTSVFLLSFQIVKDRQRQPVFAAGA